MCPKFLEDIRKHPDKFFKYYRTSIASFDELLETLRPLITKQETSFKKPINAEERLSVTLSNIVTVIGKTDWVRMWIEWIVVLSYKMVFDMCVVVVGVVEVGLHCEIKAVN
ncbi:hypothetical protein NQ318_007455 [Aromia moschata]|uniref:Uncharacterized protein n=1 Tax=Aromia moschata TaxID=1265417 RepID=A0AAV8YNP7_9CUCU|nr:hypothetical protein NQ318_007455 [Aromia moschata]